MELVVALSLVLAVVIGVVGVRAYLGQPSRRHGHIRPESPPGSVRAGRPARGFSEYGEVPRRPQALRRAPIGPPMAAPLEPEQVGPPMAATLEPEQVGSPWSMRLGPLVGAPEPPDAANRRRLLVRDTSMLLMVMGVLVLLAGQLPTSGAQSGDGTADPGAVVGLPSGSDLPTGSFDLLSSTPGDTTPVVQTATPTLSITRATLPPWCGNPTCTILATPKPTPTATPTASPSSSPTATPTAIPTATLSPTPTPTDTPVPTPTPHKTPPPTDSPPPPTDSPTP